MLMVSPDSLSALPPLFTSGVLPQLEGQATDSRKLCVTKLLFDHHPPFHHFLNLVCYIFQLLLRTHVFLLPITLFFVFMISVILSKLKMSLWKMWNYLTYEWDFQSGKYDYTEFLRPNPESKNHYIKQNLLLYESHGKL